MSTNQDSGSNRLYDIPFLDDSGSNYSTWKYRISTILDIRGLMAIVLGDEKCPLEQAPDIKDQAAFTLAYEKWKGRDKQAKAQITLTLRDEPLSGVVLCQTAAEVWEKLETRYEGKGQHTVAQLIGEIFRGTFAETTPLEQQFNLMRQKVHKLKSLGHDLTDSLIATAMIVSLPDSYSTLRQLLFMTEDSKLTTDFVIRQALMEERTRGGTQSHVALMGNIKGKKPSNHTKELPDDSTAWKKNLKCHYCKKKGHIKSECRKLKSDQAGGNPDKSRPTTSGDHTAKVATTAQEESVVNLFMAREGTSDLSDDWIVDSGATAPMTARKEWFSKYTPFDKEVSIGLGDDSIIKAAGSGSVMISMDVEEKKRIFELRDVYYVPDMGRNNLLSVSYMVNKGYLVHFRAKDCVIQKGNDVIGNVYKKNNLWVLSGKTVLPRQEMAYIAQVSIGTWHKRLGHAMVRSIEKLANSSMVTGMRVLSDEESGEKKEHKTHCIPCLKGKTTREPISKKSTVENPKVLHRVFSDVCGPLDIEGYQKCRYFVTLIDGYSHYMRVQPIRSKDEAPRVLMDWMTRSEVETGEKVNQLRTDGGGEYMGAEFQTYLKRKGVHHEVTNAGTPQENGVAERMNRTILEMTRSMLLESALPKSYWTFAVSYTQEVLNRLPSRALTMDITPYEAYFGKKPSVEHLRIFGCSTYVHIPDDKRGKLDPKAVEGVFVGVPRNRKGYIVADKQNFLKTYVSRDVTFLENPDKPEQVRVAVDDISPGTSTPLEHDTKESKSEDEVEGLATESEMSDDVESDKKQEKELDSMPTQPRRSERVRHAPVRDDDSRYMTTSYSRRPRQPQGPQDSALLNTVLKDPLSYEEAMSRPDAIHWKRACAEEMEEFVRQKVFSIVTSPKGRKVIGCKWVFKMKHDADGQVERYKARLVAQGFSQIPGIDFSETFAPVTRHQTFRTLLALANRYHWHIHQMDVKTAFLNGNLENEIYMKIPPGVESDTGQVWLLHKALYGLKQASREWYLKLKKQLEDLGFKRSNADHGVFTKASGGKIFIIAVYVDDFLLFSELMHEIKKIKSKLKEFFEMKDLGEAKWILQMRIERSESRLGVRTLSLSQEQYVEEVLERHGMADCNPVKTPMEKNIQLPVLKEAEVDITEYQRCIGSLMYLMVCTRPDIAYSVGVLSRHVSCPGNVHMQAIKRVFRYLRGTSQYSLQYKSNDEEESQFEIFVDADWAGDRVDRKSISGFVVMLEGGAISWGSKKQTSVSLSTVEAEFVAASMAVREALWHRVLYKSLDFELTNATRLFIDNQGALDLMRSGQINDKTKHIDIKFRHICDREEAGDVTGIHVTTENQLADMMTKSLGGEKFMFFRAKIGVKE